MTLSTWKRLLATVLSLSLLLTSLPAQAGKVTRYVHTDHLGSPAVKTDSTGAEMWRQSHSPYGEDEQGPTPDGPGYTGHRNDAATGLVYMQARYYDPEIGRFLSVDPVTFSPNMPQHFNRYWYANGNPYYFVDLDGRQATVGAASGATCESKKCETPPPSEPPKKLPPVVVTATAPVPPFLLDRIRWNLIAREAGAIARGLGSRALFLSLIWPSPIAVADCETPGGPSCGVMTSDSFPPGFWPGDVGAVEWGKRNGVGAREGKNRFHDIKRKDKGQGGGRGTDKYGVNPDTGDVVNPQGENVGNLGEVKSK